MKADFFHREFWLEATICETKVECESSTIVNVSHPLVAEFLLGMMQDFEANKKQSLVSEVPALRTHITFVQSMVYIYIYLQYAALGQIAIVDNY